MLNKVILMGRLTSDPELKHTQSGTPVISFAIAVDRNYGKEKQTDFIDVVAWRNTAEFISKYFSKGRMIVIDGAIQTRMFEDRNGSKRIITEVVAGNVDFGEPKREPMKPEELITISQKGASQEETFSDNGYSDTDDDDLPF